MANRSRNGPIRVKRVLVTGGTGFIGRHVVSALVARGDRVTMLTRRAAIAQANDGGALLAEWTPGAPGAWSAELAGVDAVVHLAGARAVGGRLTKGRQREITSSRIDSTRSIVEAIGTADPKPSVLVCASAVGIYGPHAADELLDESAQPGQGFLADLVVAWEAAAQQAKRHGVRVVSVRFGIVLGKGGGALPQMARPFRIFVGGPIAGGDQIVSWIHVEDATAIMIRAIDDASLHGPINAVAPNPVSNRELAQGIATALGRRSWLPVPGALLELLLGAEGALPIVTGQRVAPRVLEQAGFSFRYPELGPALEDALS
jgi:uncharacterized protein